MLSGENGAGRCVAATHFNAYFIPTTRLWGSKLCLAAELNRTVDVALTVQ